MAEHNISLPPSTRGLSEAQSLSLVQIFLNASLACIAHTRELIPWTSPSLQTRYIDQIDPAILTGQLSVYEAFQVLDTQGVRSGQEIRVLVHGGHRCADQILGLLETGVFSALEHGHLETLQVFVTDNDESPRIVIESYSFAFSYDRGRVSTVKMTPTNQVFVLEQFQKSFKAAIRVLLRSLKPLHRLPARRKLGMSLSYNDRCPDNYQPTGFVDSNELAEPNGPLICEALERTMGTTVGSLHTGHHSVNVGVSGTISIKEGTSLDPEDAAMSKQLQAMQQTSSVQGTNLVSTLPDCRAGSKRRNSFVRSDQKRLKRAESDKIASNSPADQSKEQLIPIDDLETSQRGHDEATPGGSASSGDTQVRKCRVTPDADADEDEDIPVTLSVRKLATLLIHCYALNSEAAGGGGDIFDQDLLRTGIIRRVVRSDKVRCECGSVAPLGPMIYCEVCDEWQHAECYGYKGASDTAAPSERFCYTCLLFSPDEETAISPAYIVYIRLAMRTLTNPTMADLVVDKDKLQSIIQPPECAGDNLNRAIDHLLSEGVLRQVNRRLWQIRSLPWSKSKGLNDKYGNPFAYIGHLYDMSKGAKDPRQRSNDIAVAIEEYAQGQDFTKGEGCVKVSCYEPFGELVVRWSYFNKKPPSGSGARTAHSPPITPAPRRKLSVSRFLVNIDRSPSTMSMSCEGTSLRIPDSGLSSDFSPGASTATAD
ncbi:hypothetical protein ABEF93_006143 [Exophiala dermatitidis]